MKEEATGQNLNSGPEQVDQRTKRAIQECKEYIRWYEANKNPTRRYYLASQIVILILGALTPALILADQGGKILQASLTALVAIAGGLNNIYRWQENWVRYAASSEFLSMELVRFETRTTEHYEAALDDQAALSNFVQRFQSIAQTEIEEFRSSFAKQDESKVKV